MNRKSWTDIRCWVARPFWLRAPAPEHETRLLLFSRCGVKRCLRSFGMRTGCPLTSDSQSSDHSSSKPRRVVNGCCSTVRKRLGWGTRPMLLDGGYGMEGEYVTYSRRGKVQRYRIPCIEQSGRVAIKYPIHPERSAGEGQRGALVTLDARSLIRIPNHTAPAQQQTQRKACEKTAFSSAETRCTAISNTLPLRIALFSSTGTRSAVGRFPRFFPGFWWI